MDFGRIVNSWYDQLVVDNVAYIDNGFNGMYYNKHFTTIACAPCEYYQVIVVMYYFIFPKATKIIYIFLYYKILFLTIKYIIFTYGTGEPQLT